MNTVELPLHRDPWGRLILREDDESETVVLPVRAFPISDTDHWLSLVAEDGREAACIERISELGETTRRLLEEELAQREFMPVIERIVATNAERAPAEWKIVTDRGAASINLPTEEHVHRLGPNRFLIIDAHGIRYLLPDALSLDAHSRRILDKYL